MTHAEKEYTGRLINSTTSLTKIRVSIDLREIYSTNIIISDFTICYKNVDVYIFCRYRIIERNFQNENLNILFIVFQTDDSFLFSS